MKSTETNLQGLTYSFLIVHKETQTLSWNNNSILRFSKEFVNYIIYITLLSNICNLLSTARTNRLKNSPDEN